MDVERLNSETLRSSILHLAMRKAKFVCFFYIPVPMVMS
jgi:hypothetical protein